MNGRRRFTLREAISEANRLGIRMRRKRDGHVLFFMDGNRTVNVSPGGKKEDYVPPRLAVYLERKAKP